jgi:hypothetical protein
MCPILYSVLFFWRYAPVRRTDTFSSNAKKILFNTNIHGSTNKNVLATQQVYILCSIVKYINAIHLVIDSHTNMWIDLVDTVTCWGRGSPHKLGRGVCHAHAHAYGLGTPSVSCNSRCV